MGLLDRIGPRKGEFEPPHAAAVAAEDPVFATKALHKFLRCLTARELPVLLDLGPVVGSNVSFFGEQLGCKILVEDIFADLDRHLRGQKMEALPAFLTSRFTQQSGTVDGILCWDIFDYLDRPSAQALATGLNRVLAADGTLLAFFSTASTRDARYTKFIIVDDLNMRHRAYPAARTRQVNMPNRDILRLFPGLHVSDSFLLQNNQREILFRKPASTGH